MVSRSLLFFEIITSLIRSFKEVQAMRITKLLVLVSLIVLPFSIVHAADYDNIAFMKYVPKELREKFPVCDEFLDIKWIDPKRYIGKMQANIYEGIDADR